MELSFVGRHDELTRAEGERMATEGAGVGAPSEVRETSAVRRVRLRTPTVSAQYVRRPRLLDLMDAAATYPLTIISAGAGAGKTTLAAGWAAERAEATAWISLDSTDRDPSQFWAGISTALQTLVPECGARARMLIRQGAPLAEAVEDLLDDLDSADRAASILIVDDLHLVDDDEKVADSLALFVRYLPEWLHLVLLTRHDLSLPRDRMRAQGRLCEIRFDELRFADDEARDLMSRLAPTMSDDGVDAAARRAAGWAAALQLSALAARSATVREAVTGSDLGDDLVQDYVMREVLAAEAPELVDALLRIAAVRRVNPSLAQALTGRPDADQLLRDAEARGLFVSRLGGDGWYELHALAAAALTTELRRRAPTELAALHARAARWFEQAGEVPTALGHWLAGGRPRDALRLLAAEGANLYDNGHEATISVTLADIGPKVIAADADCMIEYAWCNMLVDRRRFLDAVERLTWWSVDHALTGTQVLRLAILQSMAAVISARWVESGTIARRAASAQGEAAWQDSLGRFGSNMIARDIAYSERWDETSDEVQQVRLSVSRDPGRRVAFEATRALGAALAGRPWDALRVAAGIRHAVSVSNMTVLRAELTTAEALARREIGDRLRATTDLSALAQTPVEAMFICRVLASLDLTLAHVDGGELGAARLQFEKSQELVEGESFGADGHNWFGRVGVLLSIASGDIDLADQWCDEIEDSFWRAVSVSRVELARGLQQDAMSTLEGVAPRCVRHEVVLSLLKARAADDRERSSKYVAIAVEQAAMTGMVQTVASEGPEIVELAERSAARVPAAWLARLRRVAGASTAPLDRLRLVEPLTERERDVLRFLPSRLTVREISDELYVSVNTLKFHLKVIYRKLGVSSRAEAAEMARSIARLPRKG